MTVSSWRGGVFHAPDITTGISLREFLLSLARFGRLHKGDEKMLFANPGASFDLRTGIITATIPTPNRGEKTICGQWPCFHPGGQSLTHLASRLSVARVIQYDGLTPVLVGHREGKVDLLGDRPIHSTLIGFGTVAFEDEGLLKEFGL